MRLREESPLTVVAGAELRDWVSAVALPLEVRLAA